MLEYPISRKSKDERKELIQEFLKEMYFERTKNLDRWAALTGQTPQIETKFLGQTLVSLVTGIPGCGTAARGKDLSDGSEVKSCTRVGQMKKCKDCKKGVPFKNEKCPNCGSSDLEEKTDSHWIFTINTEEKLNKLKMETPFVYLFLIDNEDLPEDQTRFRIWRIQPRLNKKFQEYLDEYYQTYFLARKEKKENWAPMNLHPLKPKTNKLGLEVIFEAILNSSGSADINTF